MDINRRELDLALNRFVRSVRNNDGFTLVELIIVTLIISALAFAAISGITELRDKARISRAATEIRGLEKDIISYASEKGTYPPNLDAAGMITLKDPWGRPYEYTVIPVRTNGPPINSDFDLYSKGPDGLTVPSIILTDGKDDIVRGNDGGYVGAANKYF